MEGFRDNLLALGVPGLFLIAVLDSDAKALIESVVAGDD